MENICRMRCLPHPSSPSLSEPCLSLSCLTKSPVCLLFILLLLILQSSHFLALSLCPKLGFSQFWVLFLHTPNKLTPSPVNFPCIWSQVSYAVEKLTESCTHPSGFSSRLAGDPTISPRVQNIWPKKSWKEGRKDERKERKEEGGKGGTCWHIWRANQRIVRL